jgi:hypothetical protein
LNPVNNAQGLHRANRPSQSIYYEIRVQGQLDSHWSDWFNGLDVRPQENGETVIVGPVPDQAILHGILTKIFNLRLLLISVKRIHTGS